MRSQANTDESSVEPPGTDHECRETAIRAEKGDVVSIDGYGEFRVKRRTDCYYGPKLVLTPDEADQSFTVMLTAPGPKQQLRLWWPDRDRPGWRTGWIKGPEVHAELVDVKQYDICPSCGEPVKNEEHEFMSIIGGCEPEWFENE